MNVTNVNILLVIIMGSRRELEDTLQSLKALRPGRASVSELSAGGDTARI